VGGALQLDPNHGGPGEWAWAGGSVGKSRSKDELVWAAYPVETILVGGTTVSRLSAASPGSMQTCPGFASWTACSASAESRDNGRMPSVADDLLEWPMGLLADAGRGRLAGFVLDDKQERPLHPVGKTVMVLSEVLAVPARLAAKSGRAAAVCAVRGLREAGKAEAVATYARSRVLDGCLLRGAAR
jgi:hypothetical protein